MAIAKDCARQVAKKDMFNLDDKKRNPETMARILWSYARNVSTLAASKSLVADASNNFASITTPTFYDYIDVLNDLHLIREMPAWSLAVRSKTAIRSDCKREFVDPSIATASSGLSLEYFLRDLKTFGFMFENLCV